MIYITLHRRTDNTMTTRKRTNNDIQYNDHKNSISKKDMTIQ